MAGFSQLDLLVLSQRSLIKRLYGPVDRSRAVVIAGGGGYGDFNSQEPPTQRRNLAVNASFEFFDLNATTPKSWTTLGAVTLNQGVDGADGAATCTLGAGGSVAQNAPGTTYGAGAVTLSVFARSSTPGTYISLDVTHTPGVSSGPTLRTDGAGYSEATAEVPSDGSWYRFSRSFVLTGGSGVYFSVGCTAGSAEVDVVNLEYEAGATGFVPPSDPQSGDYGDAEHLRDLSADNIRTGTLTVGGSNPKLVVEDSGGAELVEISDAADGIRVKGGAGIVVDAGGSILAGTPGGSRVELESTGLRGYNGGTNTVELATSDGKLHIKGSGGVEVDASGSVQAGQVLIARDEITAAESGADPASVGSGDKYVRIGANGLYVNQGAITIVDDEGALIMKGSGLTELAIRKNEIKNPSFEVFDKGALTPRDWLFNGDAIHNQSASQADGLTTALLPGNGVIEQDFDDMPPRNGVVSVYARASLGVPTKPNVLGATALDASTIAITWNDRAGNEDGFKIYRSPDDATWGLVADVGANTVRWDDTGLSPSTTYYYKVEAYNSAGSNAADDSVLATTPASGSTGYGVPSRSSTPNTSTVTEFLLEVKDQTTFAQLGATETYREDANGNLVSFTGLIEIPDDGNWYRVWRRFNNATDGRNVRVSMSNDIGAGRAVELDRVKMEFGPGNLNPTLFVNTDWALAYQIRELSAENITAGTLTIGGGVDRPSLSVEDGSGQEIMHLNESGAEVLINESYEAARAYTFKDGAGTLFGGVYGKKPAAFNNMLLKAENVPGFGSYTYVQSEADALANSEVHLEAHRGANQTGVHIWGQTDLVTVDATETEVQGNLDVWGTVDVSGVAHFKNAVNGEAALIAGSTSADYSGGWDANIQLNGDNTQAISFHDNANRVDSIIASNGNISVGPDVGWGRAPSFQVQTGTFYVYSPTKYVYNTQTAVWKLGGMVVPQAARITLWAGVTVALSNYGYVHDLTSYGIPATARGAFIQWGCKYSAVNEGWYILFSPDATNGDVIQRASLANSFIDGHAFLPLDNGNIYVGVYNNPPNAGSMYLYITGYVL